MVSSALPAEDGRSGGRTSALRVALPAEDECSEGRSQVHPGKRDDLQSEIGQLDLFEVQRSGSTYGANHGHSFSQITLTLESDFSTMQ